MAQYSKKRDSKQRPQKNDDLYEVMMLAANKTGIIVDSNNPLPVTIGGESVTITGDVNIPGVIEISNDEGNPIPTHTHLYDENDSEYSASNPLTVDGTVNIGTMPDVTLNQPIAVTDNGSSLTVDGTVGITGDVNVTQGTTPWTVSGTVTVQETGFNSTGNLNGQIDAFGRLRVSNPYTIFDNSFRTGEDTRIWDTQNTGTASTTWLQNESSIAMDIGTADGDKCIRETTRVFQYQPGKSLLCLNTFVMEPAKTNLTQRVGFFQEHNGIMLELIDNTVYWTKRSKITGSVVNTQVAQADWNIDKLDGTGPSGITLDISKAQIMWMDLEWLGVGSVRTGFVINGQFIICHIFHHANSIDSVYMTSATLPVRYEIENTGTTASTSRLKHICNSVMSEGGWNPIVQTRSAGTSLTGLAMSKTVYRPLISIRLKSAFARDGAVVVPTTMNLYGIQSNAFGYKILQNPTITGGTWVSAGDESTVEYNISATALTGGRAMIQGLFMGGDKGAALQMDLKDNNHQFQLRRSIDGTQHIFCIAAIATDNNDYAIGSMNWSEFN